MAQKYEVGQVAWVLIDSPLDENYWDCCRWDGKQWVDFRRYEYSKKSILEVRLIEPPKLMQEAA